MDWSTVIGSGVSAVGSGIGSIVNYGLSRDMYKYQKDLNERMMQREDTAVQRAVADYKAAGLSPLNAVGNASDTGSYSSASAPQLDTSSVVQSALDSYNAIQNSRLIKAQADKAQAEADASKSSDTLSWSKFFEEQSKNKNDADYQRQQLELAKEEFDHRKSLDTHNANLMDYQAEQIKQALADSKWYNENVRQTKFDLELDALQLANQAALEDFDQKEFKDWLASMDSMGDSILGDAIRAVSIGSRAFGSYSPRSRPDSLRGDYGDSSYNPFKSQEAMGSALKDAFRALSSRSSDGSLSYGYGTFDVIDSLSTLAELISKGVDFYNSGRERLRERASHR